MITANDYQVGVRTDSAATSRRLLDELGWQATEAPFSQPDLSVDLGTSSESRRPIVSLLHGERTMVRSHDPDRIIAAAQQWLTDLTSPEPTAPFLPGVNAALLPSHRVVITPRWLTGDSALLERFTPAGTRWLDGRHVQLDPDGDGVAVVGTGAERWGPVSGLVLDRGVMDADLSSPARRTATLIGRINVDDPAQRFEVATRLADEPVTTIAVDLGNVRQACIEASELFADVV